MPMSQQFTKKVAEIILKEIGPKKGERLLNMLLDQAIIDNVPYSPKQSIIYIRNEFLLLMAKED